MTELSIRPDEIRDALRDLVESYDPSAGEREEIAVDGVVEYLVKLTRG